LRIEFRHGLFQQSLAASGLIAMTDAPKHEWHNQRTRREQDAIDRPTPTGSEFVIDGSDDIRVLLIRHYALQVDIVRVAFKFHIKAALDGALGDLNAITMIWDGHDGRLYVIYVKANSSSFKSFCRGLDFVGECCWCCCCFTGLLLLQMLLVVPSAHHVIVQLTC
jgi:hypothetical protein